MGAVAVIKEGTKWVWQGGFETRHLPKAAAWRWDPAAKRWWTDRRENAAKLADHASAEIKAELEGVEQARKATLEASRATDAAIEVPVPDGLAYLPFQRAGIAYAAARPATLIGDEMGLGKTIQALGLINADPTLRKILLVVPASLKLNWRREAEKWLTRPFAITTVTGTKEFPKPVDGPEIVIVNYDVLAAHADALRAVQWDLVVVDEVHKLKNPKTKRTVALLGKKGRKGDADVAPVPTKRKLALTGTPIVNRPIELWPILEWLDPATFPNFFGFAKRYCNAHQGRYGWDFDGAKNLDELQEKLRASVMVRRLKADVLTELPPKTRQVVVLNANGASKAVEAEKLAWDKQAASLTGLRAAMELAKAESAEAYAEAVLAYRAATRVAFTEMSLVRHRTALAKVEHVVEHAKDLLEDDDGKVIIFAHHHDVIAGIVAGLGEFGAVKLTGEDSLEARDAAVQRFQTDPLCRVFVGSIQAAGVGLTLTASSRVLFAELDWVPGNVTQAEDRAHRIGQTQNVLVQHLVFEGSLDERFVEILLEKQKVIDAALDDKHADRMLAAENLTASELAARKAKLEKQRAAIMQLSGMPSLPNDGASANMSIEELEAEAEKLAGEKIAAIHTGLKVLAGMCDGAHELDGVGFSKIDVRIGHDLAARRPLSARQAVLGLRLCTKYRRQLPAELLAQIAVGA